MFNLNYLRINGAGRNRRAIPCQPLALVPESINGNILENVTFFNSLAALRQAIVELVVFYFYQRGDSGRVLPCVLNFVLY